jgi:hypothetical protein
MSTRGQLPKTWPGLCRPALFQGRHAAISAPGIALLSKLRLARAKTAGDRQAAKPGRPFSPRHRHIPRRDRGRDTARNWVWMTRSGAFASLTNLRASHRLSWIFAVGVVVGDLTAGQAAPALANQSRRRSGPDHACSAAGCLPQASACSRIRARPRIRCTCASCHDFHTIGAGGGARKAALDGSKPIDTLTVFNGGPQLSPELGRQLSHTRRTGRILESDQLERQRRRGGPEATLILRSSENYFTDAARNVPDADALEEEVADAA